MGSNTQPFGIFVLPALLAIFTMGIVSAPASGAQVAPNTLSPATQRFSVTGTVVNSVTGEPIQRALVQVMQRIAFTDPEGHFQLDGMQSGSTTIRVQRPGFFSEDDAGRRSQVLYQLSPNMDSLQLKLTPYCVVHGRVTNAAGEPLESIPLRLTFQSLRGGRKHWNSRGFAQTDENGTFRFPNLMPGSYYLAAGPSLEGAGPIRGTRVPGRGQVSVPGQPTAGYPNVYYPGVPDLNSAAPIELAAGQQLEADFALSLVPVYTVSGSIVGYPSESGVSLLVQNQSGDTLPMVSRFNRRGIGDFEAFIPAGVYVLTAMSQGPGGSTMEAQTHLTVASNLTDVRITMAPMVSIPVVVKREPRTAVSEQGGSGRSAYLGLPDEALVSVRLSSSGIGMADYFAGIEGTPPHRSMVIRNVAPGKYSVEIDPHGDWYVQSAEYGQTNLLTDDLTLTPGAQASPISVVISDDSASLSGTVKSADGSPAAASVLLVPARGAKAALKMTQSFPGQGFNFNGVSPGEYLAIAVDDADRLEYANPDSLQPYLSQATHVNLVGGQKTTVDLKLIPTGE
jgi:hypothetical protein